MLTSEGQSQITQSLVGDKEAVSTWPTGPNLFLDPKGPKVSILTTPHREANLKTEEKNVFWQWQAPRTHLKTQRKEGTHVQNRASFRTPGLAVSGTTACWVIASLSSYLWAKFYKQACSCHPDSLQNARASQVCPGCTQKAWHLSSLLLHHQMANMALCSHQPYFAELWELESGFI